ncbi:hypothetical protein CK203_101050 [Vitis vinifera]|uniref:Uncharacterized protein n=1 Tax=Vitis vinifera TaxID=29760 RepID=A0A438FI91_VITVI|nr:hypothetical protein CK203_101050 [Vitis vinifera]
MYLQLNGGDQIWSFGQSLERKREERKRSFSHHAQISSNVRSHFVRGPIELKFEGEVRGSCIFNMNGGDRIWSFGQSLERKRRREKNSGFLHHAQISSKVRCRFLHGLIELKFGGERSKLEEALSFGDSHIDLIGSIVEYGAPRICYYSKFGKRVDPKLPPNPSPIGAVRSATLSLVSGPQNSSHLPVFLTLGSNAKFHERRARLSPANIMPPHNSSHIPIVSNAVTSASNAKLQERKARLSAANIMPGSSFSSCQQVTSIMCLLKSDKETHPAEIKALAVGSSIPRIKRFGAIILTNFIENGLSSRTKSHHSILPPVYQLHFNQTEHLKLSPLAFPSSTLGAKSWSSAPHHKCWQTIGSLEDQLLPKTKQQEVHLKDKLATLKKGSLSVEAYQRKFKRICDNLAAINKPSPTLTRFDYSYASEDLPQALAAINNMNEEVDRNFMLILVPPLT